jgi:septal ring factor EnvC (AmiA/AmiB activator)
MRGSLLEQAHNALSDAERAEANEQVKLATLEAEDLRLHEEVARAKAALEAAEGREALLAARERLAHLSRTRETLIRQKAAQEQCRCGSAPRRFSQDGHLEVGL